MARPRKDENGKVTESGFRIRRRVLPSGAEVFLVDLGRVDGKRKRRQFATITEDTDLKPFKAFCRMVAWDHGTFQLDAYDETTTFAETFKESTESLLIEALRQCDEMRRLLPMLPPPETRFRLKVPLAPKLSSLKSAEIETLQLAINGACLKDAIEQSPGTDHEAMQAVHKLLKEGFLVAG